MWRCLVFCLASALASPDYYEQRTMLIEKSRNRSIGARIKLTPDEEIVNRALLDFKRREFDAGFNDPEKFLPLRHFFFTRDDITKSGVFKIIRKMPKGASLHSHDLALVSDRYVFDNLTYREDLWLALDDVTKKYTFKFSKVEPEVDGAWRKVSDLRKTDPTFNDKLKSQLTLIDKDPQTTYADIDLIWNAFQSLFVTITSLLSYEPVFRDYFYRALEELYQDNVKYLEFRGLLPELYDLDGRVYDPEQVLEIYHETAERFKRQHADFVGVKFIYAPSRRVNPNVVDDYVSVYQRLKRKRPKFLAGFDLVGQEDLGRPLIDFLNQLQELAAADTKFFFHAGETNWFFEPSDLNLYDAVLLNASRIGHGYAILKHPELLKLVKERGIAIEIAPISNQVLKLVDDIRNHPGNYLIANDYPVVITCDDPSFWGAEGLSFDWYVAFMGMSGRETDLRLLKQLAINSIEYSSLDVKRKRFALKRWRADWDLFVRNMIESGFNLD